MPDSEFFRAAIASFLFCIAPSAGAQTEIPSADLVQDFLITSAAADFSAHQETRSVTVRSVHLRSGRDEAGRETHVLCGKFQTAAQATQEWSDFATLKTVDYEQWLGKLATAICNNARVSDGAQDLSAILQAKLLAVSPVEE